MTRTDWSSTFCAPAWTPASKINVSWFFITTFRYELVGCCLCDLSCRCLEVTGLGSWNAYWSCFWAAPLPFVATSFARWICAFIPWAFAARPTVPNAFGSLIESSSWAVFNETSSSWARVTAFVFLSCAKSCLPAWRPTRRLIREVLVRFFDCF